jgi:hypothetical protein
VATIFCVLYFKDFSVLTVRKNKKLDKMTINLYFTPGGKIIARGTSGAVSVHLKSSYTKSKVIF